MERILVCPRCGFRFSVSYARALGCAGCPLSVRGCQYVKCPNCGYEGLEAEFRASPSPEER